MKKRVVALLMATAVAASFAACGSSSDDSSKKDTQTSQTSEAASAKAETENAVAPGDAAGFTEIPIFEDQEAGFLNVSAVYFQPVPMSNGNENIDDFNIHLEADVSALENDLGYPKGDWVPYMTVDYKVETSDGNVAAEGTFMEMNASDGPHYGANIKLPDAGTYNVTFTFHSPEDNGYLIHTDSETGPGGTFDEFFADGPLVVTYEGWDYTPQEW